MPFVMAFDILVQVSIPIYKKYNQKTQIQNEQNEHIAQELEKNLFKELEKNLKKNSRWTKTFGIDSNFFVFDERRRKSTKKIIGMI